MPPVAPLSWNTLISQAAIKHSTDMATKNFYSHTGSDGSGVFDRMTAAGYTYENGGEILIAGRTKIPDAINAFLASHAHCSHIMQADFDEVGAACVSSSSSQFKHYLTINFGS